MIFTSVSTVMFCTTCGDDRDFEQPPCQDEHGADCPEWCCIDCGSAIIVAPQPGSDRGQVGGRAAAGRTAA